MDRETARKFQIVMLITLLAAGARTAWILYQRSQPGNTAGNAVPGRKLHADDYIYLRPSHVYDLASTKKFLVGKTVWVRAGNVVAYYPYSSHVVAKKEIGILAPLARLDMKDVVMNGTQMYGVFMCSSKANPDVQVRTAFESFCAVPIGAVKHGDATIDIDDLFFYEDPHKLYDHWTKEQWAAVERHEITPGMSEAMATAALGVPHAPESGANGDYGNRTLLYSDPIKGKTVTVTFVDNAATSVSEKTEQK